MNEHSAEGKPGYSSGGRKFCGHQVARCSILNTDWVRKKTESVEGLARFDLDQDVTPFIE